jgi:hypothetical protein
MKRLFLIGLICAAAQGLLFAGPQELGTVLYIYDEINEQSEPYIGYYRSAFKELGIPFEESAAGDLSKKDLAAYSTLVVHGMVMAFNNKSPVRDWLKKKPAIAGKRVSLLVTANRWFLDNLYKQLRDLFGKSSVDLVDAVSMATKNTTDAQEEEAVRAQLQRLLK